MSNGLKGKRVVVTRAMEQSEEFGQLLRLQKATPVFVPVISFAPPESWEPLERAFKQWTQYNMLIFTSGNAVRTFLDRRNIVPMETNFDQKLIAAVGPKTAKALEDRGVPVDILPKRAGATEELLEALSKRMALGDLKVLFPRAEEAREGFVEALKSAGARVDVVAVYRTVPSKDGREPLQKMLEDHSVHWLTFVSASAVRSFVEIGGKKRLKEWIRTQSVKVAVIGRVTEAALMKIGMEPTVKAETPTLESMLDAMADYEIRSSK